MKKVNRKEFFDAYRKIWGPLKQIQVNGLEVLLALVEQDKYLTDVRHCAYVLATIKHETGNFQPRREIGLGEGHKYGIPDLETGLVYYGRGYVQVTWKGNYEAMTDAWNSFHPDDLQDFVLHPDQLLVPKYSYFATSYGMRRGLFTRRSLNYYINAGGCNYLSARRIINGLDCAVLIAQYAEYFEEILEQSVEAI